MTWIQELDRFLCWISGGSLGGMTCCFSTHGYWHNPWLWFSSLHKWRVMPGSDSPFQAWMPSRKYAMAAHCTGLQCLVGNGLKLPDSNLSVTSCESSSLVADASIWYISPASSSSKSVSLTSFDLHLEEKWFLFPHFLHSFPSAGHDSLFSGC